MQKRQYYLLLLLTLLVYVVNLFVDIMDIDASQYAEISWEMLSTKKFLKVHSFGNDYLDKPPLLFWLNTVSFYLIGICNLSYKLPSMLFALSAIYSTYRFARIYYSQQTAMVASLMLATSEALFLITNDVRTDTILMASVIFAIWQWAAYFETAQSKNIVWGSVGIGLALLAKGPIGLIAVAATLIPLLLSSRTRLRLYDLRLVVSLLIVALLLLPMCIGLYEQWGSKGLKFYFWTQSFGRITGASEWNNHPDTFFLVHTTAWAFMPWSFFLFAGWGARIYDLFKRKSPVQETLSISGFTLILIALMLSKYQLPHYIFVVYPLGALMAADYFVNLEQHLTAKKILFILQRLIIVALLLVSLSLQYCLKGSDILSVGFVVLFYLSFFALAIFYKNLIKNMLWISAYTMIGFSFLVGAFYFPAILKYQPAGDFGRYVRQHQASNHELVCYITGAGFADVFYAQQKPLITWQKETLAEALHKNKHLFIYTNPTGIVELTKTHIQYKIIQERYHYPVTKMTFGFLNPSTRLSVCDKVFLLEASQ